MTDPHSTEVPAWLTPAKFAELTGVSYALALSIFRGIGAKTVRFGKRYKMSRAVYFAEFFNKKLN
jgi:hypothetical protein